MVYNNNTFTNLRQFPSVEIIAEHSSLKSFMNKLTKPIVVEKIKEVLVSQKNEFKSGQKKISLKYLLGLIKLELEKIELYQLTRVINGTGVIIHTNLGRAPISKDMARNAIEMASGYSNLEYDLSSGRRGKRGILSEKLLAVLTDAESTTIVNNNAAALFIILNTLANRKEVIISRGELVQIGGGFKIPEILNKAGGKLIEVGTTNRTSLKDYQKAITDRTRVILKVHRSNFTQSGFVEEASLKELAHLCRDKDILLVHDLGSGLIAMPPGIRIKNEPKVFDSIRAGADLTCFSGDKLLGAVQAGMIVGADALISRIKKNPLFRTIRCDKLTFALTTQVLLSYLRRTQYEDIPIWRMITMPLADLKKRGETILEAIDKKDVVLKATDAYLGGGTTPEETIPSLAISIRFRKNINKSASAFRTCKPPIIGRIEDDEFLLDLRTVFPEQDKSIIAAISKIME